MLNIYIALFMVIMLLICITFLTLLEQKVLSYIQIRKGPNVVGFMGLFQPFADALKLFLKELTIPVYSNFYIYYFSPVFSFCLSLMMWMLFPFLFYCYSLNYMFLLMFCLMSVGVYFIMVSGWSSNSSYSLLGSIRSIAQTISYEVCMILIFLYYCMYTISFNIMSLINYQLNFSFFYLNFFLCVILFVIFLAETNRAPFDFAEGESELVSGFNIEYSSGSFALIFLAEYSMILFLSLIYSSMFMFNSLFYYMFYLKFMCLSFLFIWVRGAYPRYRYDKLMNLTWKLYLMISLNMMIIICMLKGLMLMIMM